MSSQFARETVARNGVAIMPWRRPTSVSDDCPDGAVVAKEGEMFTHHNVTAILFHSKNEWSIFVTGQYCPSVSSGVSDRQVTCLPDS